MNNQTNKNFWTKIPVVLISAFIATGLWGSAFPCIKIGYKLFKIDGSDMMSQIFFAGLRFTLAGIMVIAAGSIQEKKFLMPSKKSILPVLILSMFQTVGQYFFFYIGLANTSGVNSAIIEAANTFFTILFAALIFKYEKFTPVKILGCLAGFAGIVLIQAGGKAASEGVHISFFGDSFILISTLCAAFAVSFIKKFSTGDSPVLLSGWQFFTGGLIMTAIGFISGGRLQSPENCSVAYSLLVYMAFISAAAYTLWSLLLKHNDVSRIAVFGFINPMVGVFLSAALLGETTQAFSLTGLLSLLLVSAGIILVFRSKKSTENE